MNRHSKIVGLVVTLAVVPAMLLSACGGTDRTHDTQGSKESISESEVTQGSEESISAPEVTQGSVGRADNKGTGIC